MRGSYVRSEIESYRETGALIFNLGYEEQEVESLLGEAGLELTYPISLSWGILQARLRTSYLREFEDDLEIVRARFLGDPASRIFRLESERPDTDFFNVAAGLTATLQRGWAAYVQYDTDLEREDLDLFTLSAGFRLQL